MITTSRSTCSPTLPLLRLHHKRLTPCSKCLHNFRGFTKWNPAYVRQLGFSPSSPRLWGGDVLWDSSLHPPIRSCHRPASGLAPTLPNWAALPWSPEARLTPATPAPGLVAWHYRGSVSSKAARLSQSGSCLGGLSGSSANERPGHITGLLRAALGWLFDVPGHLDMPQQGLSEAQEDTEASQPCSLVA